MRILMGRIIIYHIYFLGWEEEVFGGGDNNAGDGGKWMAGKLLSLYLKFLGWEEGEDSGQKIIYFFLVVFNSEPQTGHESCISFQYLPQPLHL